MPKVTLTHIQVPMWGFAPHELVEFMEWISENERRIKDMAQNIKAFKVPEAEERVKDGTKGKGVIAEIQSGITAEFLSDEAKKSWKGDLETPCLNVIVKTDAGNTITKLMAISPNPDANIQKFKVIYGDLKVGQDVETIVEKGYERLRL